jgi:hypothetical protein
MKTGGMGALMKLYNDPDFLEKLGKKLEGVLPTGEEAVSSSIINKMMTVLFLFYEYRAKQKGLSVSPHFSSP